MGEDLGEMSIVASDEHEDAADGVLGARGHKFQILPPLSEPDVAESRTLPYPGDDGGLQQELRPWSA